MQDAAEYKFDSGFFRGKTAVVTGASRGIGKATAILLGSFGANVACAARATAENQFKIPGTVDETAEKVNEAGGEGLAISTDLSKSEDIENMVATTAEHFGGIDILVNNAAVTFAGDMEMQIKHFDLIYNINVRAPFLVSSLAKPYLAKDGGRILNISSVSSRFYIPNMMAYGMSKAALDHLTVSMAAQYKAQNIAVNCFRIDTQVASEGYVMNAPDADHSSWLPTSVAAEGICWMLAQPDAYTGQIEDMLELGERTKCMQGIHRAGELTGERMIK